MAAGDGLSDEEKQQRNVLIAVTGGAFLLPIAGVAGAVIFYLRKEERNAWIVLAAAFAGAIAWGAVFALAG